MTKAVGVLMCFKRISFLFCNFAVNKVLLYFLSSSLIIVEQIISQYPLLFVFRNINSYLATNL